MLFLSRLKMHQVKIEEKEQQQRQQEQLIAEQQYVKLQNEKLDSEISFKNAQLANTTMSLIRKNELLIELKEELEKHKIDKDNRNHNKLYENIQRLIEKDLTNDDHWKTFETHFDQAHQNFFKRLKTTYPDLTPNDLKLSAYLKLNLTTKEIAPLLNISVRGVEVHRYRLRKRLGLETDQNLVEFLMNF
jgi:DNA-binding CsgD family transcriptional regulator